MSKTPIDGYVQAQNRMLATLGLVCSGNKQRVKWIWTEDILHWNGRMRPRWVLARWKRPGIPEKEWCIEYPDIAYPREGYYEPWPETAIEIGQRPDVELTQNLVFALDAQASKAELMHQIETKDQVQKWEAEDYLEWVEFVQDSIPAFENYDWGSRSGSVSFGGI